MDREMPLEDHLAELRHRIFIMGGALLVAFIGSYFVARPVLIWMLHTVGLHRVIVVGVTEAFFSMLKVAFILAVAASSPIWVYQMAAFVVPGLLPHERRLLAIVAVPGLLLFVAGLAGGFFLIVPTVLRIMASFTGGAIVQRFTLSSVLAFMIGLTLPFGVIAELPLIGGALSRMGLVSPAWYARQRRYAILVAFTIAAILAPPDALSMILMAVPIYLVYELTALVARLAWRGGPPDGHAEGGAAR
ncbi:MAG: twin-arginine translocase subunit TatC [Thermaerobacter sp.]|nr:twin-arginine translocase subunit TatC [Thermaerobacter sp.]